MVRNLSKDVSTMTDASGMPYIGSLMSLVTHNGARYEVGRSHATETQIFGDDYSGKTRVARPRPVHSPSFHPLIARAS